MAQANTKNQKKTSQKPKRRRIALTYEAPGAESVVVAGTFSDWELENYPLRRNDDGTWKRTLTLEPGSYEYRFIVDGEWKDDPHCEERKPNEFGTQNCVLNIASA